MGLCSSKPTVRHAGYMASSDEDDENSIDEFFAKSNGLISPEVAIKWSLKGLTHAFDYVDKDQMKTFVRERRKSARNKLRIEDLLQDQESEVEAKEDKIEEEKSMEYYIREAELLKANKKKSQLQHNAQFKPHKPHHRESKRSTSLARSSGNRSSYSSGSFQHIHTTKKVSSSFQF